MGKDHVMTAHQDREAQTEQRIHVRQVTQIQASWTEGERAHSGLFTLQLILDNGVDEYILRPTSDDLDVLVDLFQTSDTAMFDLERKVLMFNTVSTDQA
jgi:hypothetical protein